jgi:hypothetical protein
MYNQLISNLAKIGKPLQPVDFTDGSRLLVLPHGGRILGLFTPGDDRNFFWTNPILNDITAAQAFYASDNWHNSGGDRIWLAPEEYLFFPKYPVHDEYLQPRGFEPGAYRLEAFAQGVRLVSNVRVTHFQAKCDIEAEITKEITAAPHPLRQIIDTGTTKYAGYTQRVTLKLLNQPSVPINLWSLAQCPPDGTLIVPTYAATPIKIFFGDVPQDKLTASAQAVYWQMTGEGSKKIGVSACAATGRIGYVYQVGEEWALIVRNFSLNPSGEYIDIPADDLDDRQYAVQACYVNEAEYGRFSEMEFHAPAIGGDTGLMTCTEALQLWAFRGNKKAIDEMGRKLLGTVPQ